MKILWNLLCQYKYIYIYISTNGRPKRKKKLKKIKGQSGSPKLHCRWTVENIVWTVAKHYSGIAAFYKVNRYKKKEHKLMIEKKKKKYILNKPKVL